MGKLVVTEFVSLDGVMEAPGGGEAYVHGGWTFEIDRGAEGDAFKLEEVREADAQLLGRVTYEGFAAAWPSRQDEAGFAHRMNTMPKYVVSSTLTEPTWANTHVISLDDVAALRDRYEGDVLVAGSVTLVRGLLERGLIDELRLMVFPVVLGAGTRLFDEGAESPLTVAETRTAGEVVILILRPKS